MSSSQILLSSTNPVASAYAGLLDVPCRVEVIVGSCTLTVRDCLKLKRDSVIRLTQLAGSDLQVTIQGVPLAAGEIVVDDETTSVKISEVLRPPSAEAQL